jgi:transposase
MGGEGKMVKLEEWGMIKALRQQGLSISEIARRVGKDRKTIRKILQQNEFRKYERSEKAKKLITPYMAYIKGIISKYNLRAKRLCREIKAQGEELHQKHQGPQAQTSLYSL